MNETLKQTVGGLRTNTDAFEVHGREIYWQRRKKQNKALFSTVPLEKILGLAFTVRGTNTIRRIVSKYCSSKSPWLCVIIQHCQLRLSCLPAGVPQEGAVADRSCFDKIAGGRQFGSR